MDGILVSYMIQLWRPITPASSALTDDVLMSQRTFFAIPRHDGPTCGNGVQVLYRLLCIGHQSTVVSTAPCPAVHAVVPLNLVIPFCGDLN